MMPLANADCRVMLGTVLRGTGARYFIQEVIGEGGQGWVFKASYDDAEGFPVVVKVLRPDTVNRESLDRFKREAEILRRLSQTTPSPFIVRFYDHGEAEFPLPLGGPIDKARLPFTVLEYVHGEPLYTVLDRQRGTGLALKRTRRILREVNKALEIVHAQGLIHRDLKPSNILLSNEAGRELAKVTDFGLVKVIDLRATATQALAGVSLSYAPPEQYEPGNPRVGPWTDVFSYGAIVHELLCGKEAYPASRANPFEALRAIATSKRERLQSKPESLAPQLRARPDVVHALDALLDHVLDPDPTKRPQTLGPVFEQIDALLRDIAVDEPAQASAQTRPGHGEAESIKQVTGPRAAFDVPVLPTRVAPVPQRRDQSDLRAWSFRVVSSGTPGAQVRDATFDPELREILTLGNAGLVLWNGAGWSHVPLAIGMLPSELRGMARLGPQAHVFAGESGIVAFLHAGALWDVRRYPDPDVVFHGVAADPTGQRVIAVGQRVSRGSAIVVEAASNGWRRTFEVPDFAPLRAACWLDDRVAYACGDAGALVRVDDAGLTRVPWERSGHLRAIAAGHGRVFAIGTGGHALSVAVTPTSRTEIEKVGTTQDLLGVSIAPDGAPWASSANARVLRRDDTGYWRRVPSELPMAGHLVRIAARDGRVMLLAEDATLLEGVL
jgi:tRNA A-37 threonylcarbamoyl transferase component Bud32